MSHEVTIHEAQISILRELLFLPSATFATIQKSTSLSSDHFNFHIKRLVELGFVEKTDQRGDYRLTVKGKEYANRLDTDNNTVERQPKVAVLLVIERYVDGVRQVVFQQRLKNPYYGFWGLPTGKLRWGETVLEGAARELMEETNLEADLEISALYHEHAVSAETGEILEDKIFFIIRGSNPRGEITRAFEGGTNVWLTPEEALAMDKKYASFEDELALGAGPMRFLESRHVVTKDQF